MKIVFLDKVNSTQDYLKNILESQQGENYLVYTKEQTNGHGRRNNNWEHTTGSLACSFNIKPHEIMTLSSLEIGVLIADYLQKTLRIDIQLKWPNDLFYQDKKVGGIIIHSVANELCVGVGINHDSDQLSFSEDSMRTGINLERLNIEELIYYIHNNRIYNSEMLKKRWLENCHHANKDVSIGKDHGVFIGLGKYGEAKLMSKQSGQIKKCISGSLRYLDSI